MAFVPKYILILFFLITVDFFAAKEIAKREGEERKKFLWLSISINLGILFFFKYFNFFNANIAELVSFFHWNYSPTLLKIALPLGLSFHVFQSLSYVIEVYRRKYPAEKNFLTYALYVMFFPQLVAGPIERPQNLLPQFANPQEWDEKSARHGLERMLWGFFKKLVIADQIALIVDRLFENLPADGPSLILIAVLFSYQLYCDFSGYSDIAIGSAQVLGFRLTENFIRPFASRSIAEFWRRWHISLGNWLRDYLYYPLALSFGKSSKLKLHFCLFITLVLIGLWHGANWTFVIMGALHGTYLIFGSITEKYRQKFSEHIGLSKFPKIKHFFQTIIVFLLVSFSFIFFRAENVGQAMSFVSHLGSGFENIFNINYLHYKLFRGLRLGTFWPIVIFLAILFMETIQYFQEKKNTLYIFEEKPKIIWYGWQYLLIFVIVFLGYFGEQAFIYFQF
jgi:D-alanyl-lipoteichoic acid acyltransferase DltB (MBOAT superfamily)